MTHRYVAKISVERAFYSVLEPEIVIVSVTEIHQNDIVCVGEKNYRVVQVQHNCVQTPNKDIFNEVRTTLFLDHA